MLDDLAGAADLVTAFNVVHETAYPERFLGECAKALKPGGRLLIVEPKGHVTSKDLAETIASAEALGLVPKSAPAVWRSHTALFVKP